MKKYTIIVCKGCGKKFRIYPSEVYDGDPEYCQECNDESKEFTKEVLYGKIEVKEEKMCCPRCGGQLTEEKFHSEQGVFDGWRCIMCGDVFDELVLEHRKFQKGELSCKIEEMIFSDQDLAIDVTQKMQK